MDYKKTLNDNDRARLDTLFQNLQTAANTYSGYPANLAFDYTELYRFLAFSINNIGDPFESSNYHVNTHNIEREVIEFFAKHLNIETSYRGYVTHGGTEGNFYGLYLGSYHYPDGIVYYSRSSHYSIEKILRVIKAQSVRIAGQENGEMNYEDLYKHLKTHKNKPAIFLLNIGSTMKGAIDNIPKIKEQLSDLKMTNYYLHADAALHGCFLPFIENPPPFDFSAGIDSIAISGHKFIGSPIPCGIAIAKQKYLKNLTAEISYVKIADSTVSGSRNGLTPLFIWYAIKRFGQEGFTENANHCLTLARYVTEKMNAMGISAWSNPYSNIIVFPRPPENIVDKWQIATHRNIAHFIVMPHHTKDFFDVLLEDLK